MGATRLALEFAEALTKKFTSDERYVRSSRHISVVPGNRFDKLVSGDRPGEQCSAYAFIDRATGDLYRAASWGRPEPLVSYQSNELMGDALSKADPYGVFLAH